MKREDFKYTATFSATARFDLGSWKKAIANKQVMASASLDDLRSLLPDSDVIKEDSDLLYTAFNAAVVNLINANDHGIATDTALAMSKYFPKRHLNLEHDRYSVVGHIISQGFSTFGDNRMISANELSGTEEPFNICLGGIVYRCVRDYIANFIEDSADPDCCFYQEVSASWEVGYNKFYIVLGSKKLKDAKIITDPEEILKYTHYLRSEGGEGFASDGTPVYCLIVGDDVRPLGCAFTTNPAAAVKGVYIPDVKDEEEDPEIDNASVVVASVEVKSSDSPDDVTDSEPVNSGILEEILVNQKEIKENLQNIVISTSQNNKTNVIKNNMKITSIQDITPDYLKVAEASDLRDQISNILVTKADEAKAKLDAEINEKNTLQNELTASKEALTKLEGEISALKEQIASKEKQEAFNIRMDEVSNSYDLTDDQRKAVASQIKELDDKSFSAWKTNFALFAKVKCSSEATEEVEVSEEEKSREALASSKAGSPSLVNAQNPNTDSNDLAELVKGLSLISVKTK